MNILQIIQKPQLRGAEMFAAQLSTHLQALGHHVTMVALFPGESALPFSGRLIRLDRDSRRRFSDMEGWRALARIIRDEKIDVVQANAGDTLKFAVFSRLIHRWKAKLIFRNANKISDFIDSAPKRLLNSFLVGRADHVVSVSTLCGKDFAKTFSWPAHRIDVVPIGIEPGSVGTVPHDMAKIFQSANVFISVGSLVPEKNHEGLVRIFSQIHKRHPDSRLLIVGKGPREEAIRKMIGSLGLEGRVHLLGYRTDVLELMKASRALLMPSLIEGLPGVILEAQYCRTPVVAYDAGGISEVVTNGKTGWLVPRNDESGFVAAVDEVLAGVDVSAITANAWSRVVNEFHNQGIAKRFLAVYEKLLRHA